MRQVGQDVVFSDDGVSIVFWGADLGTMVADNPARLFRVTRG